MLPHKQAVTLHFGRLLQLQRLVGMPRTDQNLKCLTWVQIAKSDCEERGKLEVDGVQVFPALDVVEDCGTHQHQHDQPEVESEQEAGDVLGARAHGLPVQQLEQFAVSRDDHAPVGESHAESDAEEQRDAERAEDDEEEAAARRLGVDVPVSCKIQHRFCAFDIPFRILHHFSAELAILGWTDLQTLNSSRDKIWMSREICFRSCACSNGFKINNDSAYPFGV